MNGGHRWAFSARFRRHAFGWRSQPAIDRIREALSEIKKAARLDPLLATEGAVLLLEKLSPALEQVDSSSGAIGTAVNHAIEALVPVISGAPAGEQLRGTWLDRLWQAVQDAGVHLTPTTAIIQARVWPSPGASCPQCSRPHRLCIAGR